MFEFLMDMGNYEQRKIARNSYPWGMVDTAAVSDGEKPYETAIEHSSYGDGKMVIVEAYDIKERAQAGHDKWVKIMTAKKLPSKLTDCSNSGIQSFCSMLDNGKKYEQKFHKKSA